MDDEQKAGVTTVFIAGERISQDAAGGLSKFLDGLNTGDEERVAVIQTEGQVRVVESEKHLDVNESKSCSECCLCHEDSDDGVVCVHPNSTVSHDEVFNSWVNAEADAPAKCPLRAGPLLLCRDVRWT